MKHLDLFSGIGGFAYAVDQVWENAEHIFCDNDKFCQQVLRKHWPNSKIYGDIRAITSDTKHDGGSRTERVGTDSGSQPESKTREKLFIPEFAGVSELWSKKAGWDTIDLVTGGFPCQPFSQAGKRRGKDDNRYLWPEMLRVIQEFQSTWVIAENVRGILTIEGGMVFEQVCLDLETAGYEVQAYIIPAVAVNAPHRRDRVWFVAHRRCQRQEVKEQQTTRREQYDSKSGVIGNTESTGQQGGSKGQGEGEQGRASARSNKQWEQNWLEVAAELCMLDDGLPAELDYAGWTKAQHRVQRLKALGNSIVPQVAIEIMRGIYDAGKI